MKTITKIFAVLLILASTLVVMPGNTVFADGGAALEAVSGIEAVKTGSENYGTLQTTIGKLLGFLQVASGLVGVIVIATTGFNYILSADADMKAEIKKKGLPIIVGFAIVFGAVSIAKFLIGVTASAA